MNNSSYISSVLRNNKILVKIEKKSEVRFWDYQFLGLFSLWINRGKDYFLITENQIFLFIDFELTKQVEYSGFSKIEFNSAASRLYFYNIKNEKKSINLSSLRLTYEEIQYLKSKLNDKRKQK